MQQDVDSTRRRNAIRRIARSFIETGHNRIAGAVARGRPASLAAAARRLEFRPARPSARPRRFVIDPRRRSGQLVLFG